MRTTEFNKKNKVKPGYYEWKGYLIIVYPNGEQDESSKLSDEWFEKVAYGTDVTLKDVKFLRPL